MMENTSSLVAAVMAYETETLAPLQAVFEGRRPDGERPRLSSAILKDALRNALGDAMVAKVSLIDALSFRTGSHSDERSYARTLTGALDQVYGFPMLTKLGKDVYVGINGRFEGDLVVPLKDALQRDPARFIRKNVLRALMYYYATKVACAEDLNARLEPMLRLMPWVVPLGERSDRRGEWMFVLR